MEKGSWEREGKGEGGRETFTFRHLALASLLE